MHDYRPNNEILNMDAWSDGQLRSKIWLCQLIEKDFAKSLEPLEVWIMGSWYGLLAQFLLLRERLPLKRIRLFDLDSEAIRVSEKMLNSWIIGNEVEIIHHRMDCTQIPSLFWQQKPDIVINTSSEHFENDSWLNFPAGIHFYAQSTNMDHPTHINRATSLEDFKSKFSQASYIIHSQQIEFRYPNFKFDRYMVAGIR